VHVRVSQPRHEAAGPALPAGLELAPLAEDQLCQPECKALLPYAGRARDKQHLGQAAAPGRAGEAEAGLRVSDQAWQ